MARRTWRGALIVGSVGVLSCAKQGQTPESETSYTASNDPALNDTTQVEPAPVGAAMPALAPTTEDSVATPGPVATMGPPGASMPAAAAGPEAMPALTDGQIAKVAEAVDEGEIEQAKEAQKRAKNPQVKKLATQMIQHHTKSKQKGMSLVKKAQITPEDSAVSSELTAKVQANLETLKAATGTTELERSYIDAQVAQHQEVLDLLNTRLIPNAVNADLKAQLEETRKMVELHIDEARKVQEAQAKTASAAAPAG